jgi:tetratricopeptide (TPR) repeat protein
MNVSLPGTRLGSYDIVSLHAIGLKEDPLNLMARAECAVCHRSASQYAKGNEELRQILELDETFFFPYFMLGVNLIADGQVDEARRLAEKGFTLRHGSNPWSACSRAY